MNNSSFNNDLLTDEAWLPASFQRLVDQARTSWIPLPEVARFLQRGASRAVEIIHDSVGPVGPPVRPESGALFIVDERRLSNWREDGYTYLNVPTDIRLRIPAGIQYSDGSVYGSRSSTLTVNGGGGTSALGSSYILGTKPAVMQPLVSDMVTVTFLQPHKKSLSSVGASQTQSPSTGASQLLGGGDFAEQTLVVEWSSIDSSASSGPRGEPPRFLQRRALRLPRVASTATATVNSEILSMSALGGVGNSQTEGAGWIWLVQYLEDNSSPHYTPNGIPIQSKTPLSTKHSQSNLPASLPSLENSGSPKRGLQSESTTNIATRARTRLEEEIARGLAEINRDMRVGVQTGSAQESHTSQKSSSLPDDGEIYAALYGSSANTTLSDVSVTQPHTQGSSSHTSPIRNSKGEIHTPSSTFSTNHTAMKEGVDLSSTLLRQPWQPKTLPIQKGPQLPSHPLPFKHQIPDEKNITSLETQSAHVTAVNEELKAKRIALAQKLNSGSITNRHSSSSEAVEYIPDEPLQQQDETTRVDRSSMPSKASRFPLEDPAFLRESYLAASKVPLPYDDDSDEDREAVILDDIRDLETMGESILGRSTLDEEYDGSGKEGLGPVDVINDHHTDYINTYMREDTGEKNVIKYSELFDMKQQQEGRRDLEEHNELLFDGRGSYAAIHAEERRTRHSVQPLSSSSQPQYRSEPHRIESSRARISHASTNVYKFGHTLLGEQEDTDDVHDTINNQAPPKPYRRSMGGTYKVPADPSAEYTYVGTQSGGTYFDSDDLEVEEDHVDDIQPQHERRRLNPKHDENGERRKTHRAPVRSRPRSRSGDSSVKKKKKSLSYLQHAGGLPNYWGLGLPGMPTGLPPHMQLAIQQMAQQQAFLAQAQAAQQVRPPPPPPPQQAALSSLQLEAQQILEAQAVQARARMLGGGSSINHNSSIPSMQNNHNWGYTSATMAPQFRSHSQTSSFYQQPLQQPPAQPLTQPHTRVSFADEAGPYGPAPTSSTTYDDEDAGPYGPMRTQGSSSITEKTSVQQTNEDTTQEERFNEPKTIKVSKAISESPPSPSLSQPPPSDKGGSFQNSSPPLPAQRLRNPVSDEDSASAAAMSIGLEEAAAERGDENISLAAAAAAAKKKTKKKSLSSTNETSGVDVSIGRKFATSVLGVVTLDDGSPFLAVSSKLCALLLGWRVRAAMRLKKVTILRQRVRDSRRLLDELTSAAQKEPLDNDAANDNFIRSIRTQLETEVAELKKIFSIEDGGSRSIEEISSFIRAQLRLLKGKKPTGPLIPFLGVDGSGGVDGGDTEAAARGAKRAAERKQRLVGGALGKSVMAKYSVIPNKIEINGGGGGGGGGEDSGGGFTSPTPKTIEKPWLKPKTAKKAEKSDADGAVSVEDDVTVVEVPKKVRNSLLSPQKENVLSASSIGGGQEKLVKDEDDDSFGLNTGPSGKWRVVVEVISAKALAPAFYAPGTLAAGPGLKATAPLDDAALAPDPEAREAFVVAYLARQIDATSGKVKVSGKKLETGVASKTLNPVWKKRFVFSLPLRTGLNGLHEGGALPTENDELLRIAESDLLPLNNWEVRLEVLDSDRYVRDTFMGGVIIQLSDLQSQVSRGEDHQLATLSKWIPLQAFSPGDRVRGQLQIRMRLLSPDSELRYKLLRSESDAAAGLSSGVETDASIKSLHGTSTASTEASGGFLRRKSVNPKPKKVDWSGVLPKTHSQPTEHVHSTSASGGGGGGGTSGTNGLGGGHHVSALKPMYKMPDYSKVRGKVVSQTPSEPIRSSSSTVKRKDLSSKGKPGQGGYTRFVTYSATQDDVSEDAPPPLPPSSSTLAPHRANISISQSKGSGKVSGSGTSSRQPSIDPSGAVEYMGGGGRGESWAVSGDLWMSSQVEQTSLASTTNTTALPSSKIPVARRPVTSLPLSNVVSPRAPLPASPLFNLGAVSGGDAMESVGVAIDRFFQMTAAESSSVPISIPAQGSFSTKIRSSSYSDIHSTSGGSASTALNPELHALVYGPKKIVNDVNDAARLADELKSIRLDAKYGDYLQRPPKPGGFAKYTAAAEAASRMSIS